MRAAIRRREGSVAPIFAIAVVPVIIAAGVGIDLSRAMTGRQSLQDALDATALALAHLPANTSQEALEQKAAAWMDANLNDNSLTTPTLTIVRNKGVLELGAESKVQTTLTAISGYKEMTINAEAVVKWGGKAEIVLVLDNTGSMAGTKLTRLKNAATELVETLESQAASGEAESLRLGVVPFSMTVRLADKEPALTSYRTADWMTGTLPAAYGDDMFSDDAGAAARPNRFTLFGNISQSWAGCVESRPVVKNEDYDVKDTAPTSAEPGTLFVPFFAPDEPDREALKQPGNNGYYVSANSYLTDEVNDVAAKKVSSNRFRRWKYMQGYTGKYDEPVSQSALEDGKGPNAGCTMQPILRLTTDIDAVKTTLKNMKAVGNTNIPMGLVWGWHVLSPNLPFADGKPYTDKETKKFIVLLTDGDNVLGDSDNPNHSTYSGAGYAWQRRIVNIDENASQNARTVHMDRRLEKLCANIKAQNITVYAVRIDVSGAAPKALSGCATSEEMFYNIDSTGLSEAFKDIAGSIGRLRIAE